MACILKHSDSRILAALEALSIADVRTDGRLAAASLLQSVPFSGDWPLEQLPGVAEALTQTLGHDLRTGRNAQSNYFKTG